jgi:hypothetical protein
MYVFFSFKKHGIKLTMYNFESQSFLLIYIESSFNDKSTDKSKKKENKYTDIISSNNNNINEKLERFVV